ncbi:hypothetical protein [uncultured Sneathiella sp.]|jgi:hypothetical protein|uniref:hypothetical protein n=1 Tax=uncultured Sneathiella sp. TaxID=879315 RepID=UPI0030DAE3AB|tara:strand:- start:8049 stop:8813 length:765 start_codon:yes stop_codon:yes gene_type:complete
MTFSRRNFLLGCGCTAVLGINRHALADPGDLFSGRICAKNSEPNVDGVVNYGTPSPEAVKVTTWFTDVVGIRQNFQILAADFTGNMERMAAFATIRKAQRFIVYDRANFTWKNGRTNWVEVGIMGHEVGHHIASHVFANEYSQHEQELEADRFSGFAMAKLGATLDQALSMGKGTRASSATHPSAAQSRIAIESGWKLGRKTKEPENNACKSGWLSDEKDVDGSACRIVRSCKGNQETIRLACKDYDDRWRWMR